MDRYGKTHGARSVCARHVLFTTYPINLFTSKLGVVKEKK